MSSNCVVWFPLRSSFVPPQHLKLIFGFEVFVFRSQSQFTINAQTKRNYRCCLPLLCRPLPRPGRAKENAITEKGEREKRKQSQIQKAVLCAAKGCQILCSTSFFFPINAKRATFWGFQIILDIPICGKIIRIGNQICPCDRLGHLITFPLWKSHLLGISSLFKFSVFSLLSVMCGLSCLFSWVIVGLTDSFS